MDWNDERIAALTKMWQDGMSASQVARQLGGISRSAVIGKVHRLGIAGRETPSHPRALGGRPPSRVPSARGASTPARRAAPGLAPRVPATPPEMFDVAASATILTLGEHGCRWPIGDPGEAGFGFCGRLKTGRGAYCTGHTFMAFRAKTAARKSADMNHMIARYADAGVSAPRLSARA